MCVCVMYRHIEWVGLVYIMHFILGCLLLVLLEREREREREEDGQGKILLVRSLTYIRCGITLEMVRVYSSCFFVCSGTQSCRLLRRVDSWSPY